MINEGSKLLFIGDSITDFNRRRPVGEAPGGLGDGYVMLLEGMLTAYAPEKKIRVVNTGISGDRIRDLKARWYSDVLSLKPDWLAVMIGINDVWRHFDTPFRPEMKVEEEEYVGTYRELIEKTKDTVKGMVLMAPFYVDFNREDPMTRMILNYAGRVRELAEEYGLVFCDVQAEFDEVQTKLHHMAFSADRVHPNGGNPVGHFLIARAFLKAIGMWPII